MTRTKDCTIDAVLLSCPASGERSKTKEDIIRDVALDLRDARAEIARLREIEGERDALVAASQRLKDYINKIYAVNGTMALAIIRGLCLEALAPGLTPDLSYRDLLRKLRLEVASERDALESHNNALRSAKAKEPA